MRIAGLMLAILVMVPGLAGAQAQPMPAMGWFDARASLQKDAQGKLLEETQKGVDNFKNGLAAGNQGLGWLNTALKAATSGSDFLETFAPLTAEDKGYDPNYNPPGSPQIPSHCAGSNGCGDCYQTAYDELNAVRYRFEKLRRVYQSTKSFTAAALSFGDNAASIHGIAGLAWQTERRKIEQSIKNLDASYDGKYEELVGVLQKAIQHIGQCEAQYYKEPDWYNRYGFIYYSFMADRYRR
jgi:hypothetical protein